MEEIKKNLNKLDGRFIGFCLRHKWGKTRLGAQGIFFIMSILSRFTFYINTSQTGARGHFVPQFILKRFRITDDESKKGFVYLYSKQEDNFGEVLSKDAAQIEDLYVFDDREGNKSDYSEKRLYGGLETSASKIIRQVIKTNGTYNFTFLESSILATYVGFQITRVPAFYIKLEKFICYLIEHKGLDFYNDLFIDDHNFNYGAVQKIIVGNSYGVTQEQLRSYDKKLSIGSNSGNHKAIISMLQVVANAIGNDICEKIHRKNIHILSTEEHNLGDLSVSDNPVVFFKDLVGFLDFPIWWDITNPKIWLMLPLSPTKAVFFLNKIKKDGSNYECEEKSLVDMSNGGQFANYLDEIYCHDMAYLQRLKYYFRDI